VPGDESHSDYPAAQRETLAEVPGLRVRLLALSKGQCVPWHYHTQITDTFFCMRGPMRVLTRKPDRTHTLHPGDTLSIPARTAHYVETGGEDECKFIIIQGVGEYDYVPLDD